MFFTQDDYKKIQQWLIQNSVKDTEFNEAMSPLNGYETVALVQNGTNVKFNIKELLEQLTLLGDLDFINITEAYNERMITLLEAVQLIPYKARKIGQVVTFINEEGKWVVYQYQGSNLSQWNIEDFWVDLLQKLGGLDTLVDEEDLTIANKGDDKVIKFKDKSYNPEEFSGLGRVILRKNLVDIEDPENRTTKRVNLLTQNMVSKENTIYVIQYDFDLNGKEITIPEGCVLDFQGGSLNNGIIICTQTKFINPILEDTTLSGIYGLDNLPILEYPDFRNGVFQINRDIIVNLEGNIFLDFNGYTFHSSNKNDNTLFTFRLQGADFIDIRNVSIIGELKPDNSNSSKGYLPPIDIFNVGSVYVENWSIKDVSAVSLQISRINKIIINNVTIQHCAIGISIGKKIASAQYADIQTNVMISNCSVDCIGDFGDINVNQLYGGIGIYVNSIDNVVIENCTISNTLDTATKTDGCDNVIYKNCKVRNFGKDGIKIQSINNIPIRNSKIINCIASSKFEGRTDGSANFVITGSWDVTIENCISECENKDLYITKNWKDIIIGTSGYGTPRRIKISNNRCTCNGVNAYIGTLAILEIVNNYFDFEGTITLSGGDVIFMNNVINNAQISYTSLRFKAESNRITSIGKHPFVIENIYDDGIKNEVTHILNNKITTDSDIFLIKYMCDAYIDFSDNHIQNNTAIHLIVLGSHGNIKNLTAYRNYSTNGLLFKNSYWIDSFGYQTDNTLKVSDTSYIPQGFILFTDEGKFLTVFDWVKVKVLDDGSYIGTSEDRKYLDRIINQGYRFYDTTLNKPIWWTGTKWVDATGADV